MPYMVAHNPINSQQVYTTNGENEKTAPEGAVSIYLESI